MKLSAQFLQGGVVHGQMAHCGVGGGAGPGLWGECHLDANLKSGEGEWGDTGEKELNNKQHCLRPEKAFFPPLF